MNELPQPEPQFFRVAEIALALGVNKKKVERTAKRDGWPARTEGNRVDYCPPKNIAELIISAPTSEPEIEEPQVKFTDLVDGDSQRQNVLLRQRAVVLLKQNFVHGKEAALALVTAHIQAEAPLFSISPRSLRRWEKAYDAWGLDGLVEQKRSVVGRRAFALDLEEEQILRLRANSIEHGIRQKNGKASQNIARAYRSMVADPSLGSDARTWAHGNHASKSYVPPSVRRAAKVAPLAVRLIQQGPKAMKLDGPYSECSYENVPAGHAFTADDMTANCYVWVEWPNEQGFILIRPQILAAMDIGTTAWLNIRAVMRPKGQYNKDDVWGLIGDVFDSFGLFKIAVLEGGTWQSNIIRGHKTGLDDEARFGGLKSLGVQLIHTRTPRGKIIEGEFNKLQHAADNVRGFCGRMEMKDCPEETKQALQLVQAGKMHPSQYFLHVNAYSEHLEKVMQQLNNERSDGKILRGRTPAEKFEEDGFEKREMPESAKWMYRAAYNISQVTRNGVKVHLGTGRYQTTYTYANPALENVRGGRVVVYWNDSNPDTDAVVYSVQNGRPHEFICVASRVQSIPRFGASEEQSAAEATRKKLQNQVAYSQSKSLAPYLQRRIKPMPVANSHTNIGQQIAAARAEAAEKEQTKRELNSTTERQQRVDPVTIADIRAATSEAVEAEDESATALSAVEISKLFT